MAASSIGLKSHKNPRVLIVEPNPYHGVILPGFTHLFQELGYEVQLLVRDELAKQKPFAIYPKDKLPYVRSGTAEWMKEYLSNIKDDEYDIIFYSSSVYWEKDKNNTSYFRYLKFVPSAKLGSLLIEHNLWSFDKDDNELLYSLGRVFTLLEFPFRGNKTTMVNSHYFGETRKPAKSTDTVDILLVGASNFTPDNLQSLFESLRLINKNGEHTIKVSLTGGEINIPDDLKNNIKQLGYLDFDEYYKIIEESDYLLTIFDNNSTDIEQTKYLKGTTSGTVLLSLGLTKPFIMNDKYAKSFGFDSTNAVIYDNDNLLSALIKAAETKNTKYASILKNLSEKANKIEKASLKNLSKAIDNLKKSNIKNPNIFEVLNISTAEVIESHKRIEALKIDNKELKRELNVRRAQILDYESILNLQSAGIARLKTQLTFHSQPVTEKLAHKISNTEGYYGKVLSLPGKALRRQAKIDAKTELNKQIIEIKNSGFFDQEFYLSNNPDVAASGMDPVEHYIKHGAEEGRQPGDSFDTLYYLSKNLDVRYSQMNPLLHYLKFGKAEGRTPVLGIKLDLYDARPAIAFQLDAFDRGGLEEVVLMLSSAPSLNEKYRVYVFITGNQKGYLSEIAENRGINVIQLDNNTYYLDYLIEKLNIQLCNLHYSIFGIGTYKKRNVKLAYTIHNNYIWADKALVEQKALPYSVIDCFIPVSEQVGEFFSEKFKIPKSKIRVITNGINPSDQVVKPKHRSDLGLEKDDFVFINVASFTPNKFHADTVVAFSKVVNKYPVAKLILVGNIIDEAYFNKIKGLIDKYKINKSVVIIDYMPKDELRGLLDVSDCFVMASLTEGFSIASLEAMYHKLPLILTDVGGARHVIKNDDIGRVVNNAYRNIQTLTPEKVNTLYLDDKHLDNLNDLIEAMEDMISNRVDWKNKAELGKSKVENSFLTKHVAQNYIDEFQKEIYENADFEARLAKVIPRIKIAFFAPYPATERVTEGWMSRIRAIDSIIGNAAKIYINVSSDEQPPVIKKYGKDGWELSVGQRSVYYLWAVEKIISKVNVVYVHTLHLAEYALPWLSTNKIIVDFHGITPEEEVMLGRSYLKNKYEYIEKEVLLQARACVMVTHAMADHYKLKYKMRPRKLIILPIVENLEIYQKAIKHDAGKKYKTVYSGGTQAWQNLDAMLSLAKQTSKNVITTFFSHDWVGISELGKAQKLPQDTVYEYCKKEDLASRYKEFDFGFVLRDDTPVNRVACPTKLYEYMSSGIVPIVRLENLGDFSKFGYMYITEEDYENNKIPDDDAMQNIVVNNYKSIARMKEAYVKGNKALKKEVE